MSLLNSVSRLITLRRVSIWDFPSSSGWLAGLWVAGTIVIAVLGLLSGSPMFSVISQSTMASAMVLSALVVAWLLGRRIDGIQLAFAFMLIGLVASVARSVARMQPDLGESLPVVIDAATFLWAFAAAARLVHGSASWVKTRVRLAAHTAVGATFWLSFYWPVVEAELASRYYESEIPQDFVKIDSEALWTAQPSLVAQAVSRISSQRTDRGRTFIVSVAAGGSQQLFGREGRAVLEMFERRFGEGREGILLSNSAKDLERVPLATRTNLLAIFDGIGGYYDPRRDLAVIYLSAHGSKDAELATDLPDYSSLKPISAQHLATELDSAGITRRIVIVSACYAGSWIKPLATPDTIVIAASAADRTSFGCDDRRQYTVFGEAIINSALAQGASLSQSFDNMKRRIDREETQSETTHSLPQVFVGARMADIWNSPKQTLHGADED